VSTAVVCGNPKPRSRTLEAALFVADRLTGAPPDVVLDLIDSGPHLLGWGDATAAAAVESVRQCAVAIFASPTYKGSYTGLLKLFLDLVPTDGLAGMVAFPLMLGAAMGHAMAPDLLLKPVLVELGAACPARGLYLLETDYTSLEIIDPWIARARRFLPS
jgi:FMN reductase